MAPPKAATANLFHHVTVMGDSRDVVFSVKYAAIPLYQKYRHSWSIYD